MQQIGFYFKVLEKYDVIDIIPCLGWEGNPDNTQGLMALEQLIECIQIIYTRTGVYPMLYGSYWMLCQLGNEQGTSELAKCPLWQAFYSNVFGYLDGICKQWSILQYTDGALGPEPHSFTGIGKEVDRNIFNGTESNVISFGKNNNIKKSGK